MIQFQNVKKSYGGIKVIEDFSLEVSDDQIFGLLGLPDTGKSTLVNLLMGLYPLDSGHIFIDDMEAGSGLRRLTRRLGYVPNIPGVYPQMRVGEYLTFFASCYSMEESRIRGRIRLLLEMSGLLAWEDSAMELLPKAALQKLSFVRAILHDPKILIIDEALAGLDPRTLEEIKTMLLDYQSQGKSIFMTGSSLGEVSDFCTHLGFLHQGKMIRSGSVSKITRELSMQNPIIIQVQGKSTGLMQALKNEPKVKSISLRENEIRVGFSGTREEEAGLLQNIVESGIKLYSFYREQGSIEGVLFQKSQEERSLLSYERESDME